MEQETGWWSSSCVGAGSASDAAESFHRPRILLSVSGFPPARNFGGTTVSLSNLTSLLGQRAEFFVVTGNYHLGEEGPMEGIAPGWNHRCGASVWYLSREDMTLDQLRRLVLEARPHMIYLNSIFSAALVLPLLKVAREKGIPVLVAPRGEMCPGAMARKRLKKLAFLACLRPWLRGDNVFWHATSDDERQAIADLLNVPGHRIFTITETPTVPAPGSMGRHQSRTPPKVRGSLSLAFLGRIHPHKNLLFLLETLKGVTGKMTLDIYGPAEDQNYWKRCQQTMAGLSAMGTGGAGTVLRVEARYRGIADHGDIPGILAAHHALVLPTKSENYGHAIAESLLARRPVVLSQGTTPWDDVAGAGAGWTIPLEDGDAWRQAIQHLVDMDGDAYAEVTGRVAAFIGTRLNVPEICDQYMNAFRQVCRNRKAMVPEVHVG